MLDNVLLVVCLALLFETKPNRPKKRNQKRPNNFVLSSPRFEKAKQEKGGTVYLLYGNACNEKVFYKGRQIVVRCGYSINRCLFGVVTNFRKVPLSDSDGKQIFLDSNRGKREKYDDNTPIAEIDYRITDMTEYRLETGVPVPAVG